MSKCHACPSIKFKTSSTFINNHTQKKRIGTRFCWKRSRRFDWLLTFFRRSHHGEVQKSQSYVVGIIKRSFTYFSLWRCTLHLWDPILSILKFFKLFGHQSWESSLTPWSKYRLDLVEGLKHLAYSERLQILSLPSLEFRRLQTDIVEIFKHINIYDPATIPNRFVWRTRPTRGHNPQLLPNFSDNGVRRVQSKPFYYRAILTCNNLPRSVVWGRYFKEIQDIKYDVII